jgi:hypothetical protein
LALAYKIGHPVFTEQVLGELDDNVIRLRVGIVIVTGKPLQAGRAGGQDLDVALEAVGAQLGGAFFDLFLLAEFDLGGDVRTGVGERSLSRRSSDQSSGTSCPISLLVT